MLGRRFGNGRQNTKKIVEDYVYYLESAKQAWEYETITKFLINYVQQNYTFSDDIAETLSIHKPELKHSLNPDENRKEVLNEQYKMEFKANYDCYHA